MEPLELILIKDDFFSDCLQHKNEQCWKCNFEKTCDGLHSNNCDIIEIEKYERLVAVKKNELQERVDAAIDEARDEIKMIQSQLNEMIEKDPRISLNEKIQTGELQLSKTDKGENLAFLGLTIQSVPTNTPSAPAEPAPRLCQLMRFNKNVAWGFSMTTSGQWHIINRVAKNGAAENAGIRQNDRVLEINNEPVDGLTHEQTVQMVRHANLTLSLLVD